MRKIKRFMYGVTVFVAAFVMTAAIPGGRAHMAGPELLAGSGYEDEFLAADGHVNFILADDAIGSGYEDATDTYISEYVDRFRDKTRCDSVSAVVVTPDGTEVYGDTDALYQIGSMTKAFTALAIQKLIREGVLSENDTVSELIPGYTAYYDSKPCEITVGQLLYQTSGYTNKESDYPSATEGMSLRDWAYSMSGKELNSRPGSEYSYSNVNYDLLGAIIEQVSGKTYAEYMRTGILVPLGLTHTYAQAPEAGANIVPGSRLGYRRSFTYEIPVIEGRIPAGYFYSNATDMAEWIRIWTGTADIPEEYKELISAVKDRLNEPGDYYSGWELFENGTIGHSGGTPNYSSRIVFSDEKKTGVCVLTNLNVAASTDGLCNAIFELAAGTAADTRADIGFDAPSAGARSDDPNGDISLINIPTDVWTVFDIIFTVVSLVAILSIVASLFLKRRGVILILGITLLVLLIAVCIVMPTVFGAGLGEIALTWAPYSFAGGLILMEIGVLVAGVSFLRTKKSIPNGENPKK